ncbi:uncharacterized protein LOC108697968 [Xenopus laevis]|uniref:Uncharacterized protein LOC108697968 n=1 Tax=Xenopus laevis TaxID=8355 RepID=A0A8J0TFN8_XENLA|nr:uncharacterized protein LOC108697968 [Xenopus laevis]
MQLRSHIIRIWLFVGTWCLMVERSGVACARCDGYMAYNNKTCCSPCESKSEKINPCENKQVREEVCRCDKDFACDSKDCNSCIYLTPCSATQRTGDTIYEYTCPTKSTTPIATVYSTEKTTKNPEKRDKVHEITLYLMLVISILVLLSVIFHIFIWKAKSRLHKKHTDLNQIPQSTVIMNPKEDIDTSSCQFPEEEHGENTLDKDSMHYFLNFEC